LTLTLPAEWSQSKPKNLKIVIKAESTSGGSICVFSNVKADVVSFDAFAKGVHKYELSMLKNTQSSEAIKFMVGGRTAIRYDMTFDDGIYRWGFMEIFLETETRYNEFTVIGIRSLFNSKKEQWANLVNGLTEKPAPPEK